MGFTDPGTFIGPPGLERETHIRESPIRVPTGTTTGPREWLGWRLTVGLSFLMTIPSSRAYRKQGDRVSQLREGKTRGTSGLFPYTSYRLLLSVRKSVLGSLSLGPKVSCLMSGLSLVPHPRPRDGRDGGQGRTQPVTSPTHPARIDGGRGASVKVSPIPTPQERQKQGKVMKVVFLD